MKISTTVGTRPQFIKSTLITRGFQRNDTAKEVIIRIGQHFDQNMSDIAHRKMPRTK